MSTPPSSSSPQDPMNAVQYHDMGTDNWDPSGVQAEITVLLSAIGPGKPLTPGMTECVLGLMGTYGMQNIGLDADVTANLNANSSTISDLSTQLDNAAKDALSGGNNSYEITKNFFNDLSTLNHALNNDPFWTQGPGAPMVAQIKIQIQTLRAEAQNPGGLDQLWANNNVAGSGNNLSGSGTAGINAVNQSILAMTNMYTGVSKSVQATMQADTAMESTENDTLTNFMKKMFSFIEVMNNNMNKG